MVFVDHSVIIQALRKGLIEHEASDTGGVPRWKSSCPDRLAEATRPVEEISPYRPVPSTKPAPTVLSRRQNLPLPSRPAVKTVPSRPVPPSKPVPTVKSRGQNLSLLSRPAIHCGHSFLSSCRDRQDAVNIVNS